MSAHESGTAADPSDRGPLFPVVDGGYDRRLVDLRVAELVQQLAQEQQRAEHTEQALAQLRRAVHTGPGQGREGVFLGADMAQVLERAGVIAARVLAVAGRQVEATILAAGAKAAGRLQAAARRASDLEQQARQLLAEAELERAGVVLSDRRYGQAA